MSLRTLDKGPPGLGVPIELQCGARHPETGEPCRKWRRHDIASHWYQDFAGQDIDWLDAGERTFDQVVRGFVRIA